MPTAALREACIESNLYAEDATQDIKYLKMRSDRIKISRRQLVTAASAVGLLSSAVWYRTVLNKKLNDEQTAANNNSPNTTETASSLCSSRNIIGVGLQGEYFQQNNFGGKPLMVRTDRLLDSSQLQFSQDTKSVRWSGWVKAPISGLHRFHFDHPDARILVSKVDFSLDKQKSTEPIDMKVGSFYPIELHLSNVEKVTDSPLRLEWTPPHGYRYLISPAMLFLPIG